MATIFATVSVICLICFYLSFGAVYVPEPTKYILAADAVSEVDNPLNISVSDDYSKNYIILLGDWGADPGTNGGGNKVQKAIAQKMVSFYNKQKQNGFNLLFVGAVGDNFYMSGQNCSYWNQRLIDMYGEIATDYPWLVVFGNHDWGLHDDNAICAWTDPRYIDNATGIPYSANQINEDKKGCNPINYYLPDFGYFYKINKLNFEWIALEESANNNCGAPLGKQDWKDCNNSQKIGCDYLAKMQSASESMMHHRANISSNKNFLIINHYPAVGSRLLDDFTKIRGNDRAKDDIIWSAYGHIHEQQCQGNDSNGKCNKIMTGGGGGCCGEDTLRGFYVIGFDENKHMTQPYKFDDAEISCQYPCGADLTEEDIVENNFNYCCYTDHGEDCNLIDLSNC